LSRRPTALLLGLLASLALLLGLPSPALAYPPSPPSLTTSKSQLSALRTASPGSMTGYSRDRFPHWRAVSGTCDTRETVLERDGSGVAVDGACQPTRGSWYSVYDRVWVYDSSGVDIDHMVPLAEAWRSGAAGWSDGKRADFANDLARGQLIAVSASSNRSKGDQPPNLWKPPNTGWWCYYAKHWIDVKYDWGLSATSAEKSALSSMLGYC